MSEPAEIHDRVTRFEERMADVYDLASRADREVSGWRTVLKGHTNLLNAMGERIELFERRVDKRFAKVEGEMREGFTVLALGQAQIMALLSASPGQPRENWRSGGACGEVEDTELLAPGVRVPLGEAERQRARLGPRGAEREDIEGDILLACQSVPVTDAVEISYE